MEADAKMTFTDQVPASSAYQTNLEWFAVNQAKVIDRLSNQLLSKQQDKKKINKPTCNTSV